MASKKTKATDTPKTEPPPEGTYDRLVYEAFDCGYSDPGIAVFYARTGRLTEDGERLCVLKARKIPGSVSSKAILWQLIDMDADPGRDVLLATADHGRKEKK